MANVRAKTLTIPSNTTVDVFAAMGQDPSGEWEVVLSARGGDLHFVDDTSATNGPDFTYVARGLNAAATDVFRYTSSDSTLFLRTVGTGNSSVEVLLIPKGHHC